MSFERIPSELRELPRWIVWRWGDADPQTGKPKKPPFCATDLRRHGSSTNPETWATFEQAVAVVEVGKAAGIGFALCPPWVGVDLDEELTEAERDVIMFALDSYSEVSVSGTGLHVPDDRTAERRLFPGLNEGTMRDAIVRASRAAGLPLYSPHDLRHRKGSLWHSWGMPARELAERMGHSKPSMSLDVYTHVMAPDEVPAEQFLDLLTRQAEEVTRP